MKILLELTSRHFSNVQEDECCGNPILVDWECPFLPRCDDLFFLYEITEDYPDYAANLVWGVRGVHWGRHDGTITPTVQLDGQ